MDDPRPPTPESSPAPGFGARAPMPRWVKVSLLVAGVVIVVVSIALLSGGPHGPGRHLSYGSDGEVQGRSGLGNAADKVACGGFGPA